MHEMMLPSPIVFYAYVLFLLQLLVLPRCWHPDGAQKLARAVFIAASVLVILTAAIWGIRLFTLHRKQSIVPAVNLAIGGFPLPGHMAPNLSLVDQFGQPATLKALRGHEIVLAFIDALLHDPIATSQCYEVAHL